MDPPVREALGCLTWLTHTRPDISLPLNKVQKIAHSPTDRVWQAMLRVLSYLNATKDLGITYARGSGLDLVVWVDASYADDIFDRRSTTGLAVAVGGTIVNGTPGMVALRYHLLCPPGLPRRSVCRRSRAQR